MPHSPGLINAILETIQKDYPPADFAFRTEAFLKGTRFAPDITVVRRDGLVACVVEIGYTRPEKLTAYRRDLGIADVRWFAKDGSLHTPLTRRSVVARVRVEPLSAPDIYVAHDLLRCRATECDDLPRLLTVEARYERRFLRSAEELGRAGKRLFRESMSRLNAQMEEAEAYSSSDVEAFLVTDGCRFWCWACCDKCGAARWYDEESDFELAYLGRGGDLKDLGFRRVDASYFGGGRVDTWSHVASLASKYGLTFDQYLGTTFSDVCGLPEGVARLERQVAGEGLR